MFKPDILRNQLSAVLPFFKDNPDRLQLFYDKGKVRATAAGTNLSYEYHYTLDIVVEDIDVHPDVFFAVIMDFLQVQQIELLLNPKTQDGIVFEMDPLNNNTYDLHIRLPLTERVVINKVNGELQIEHKKEPLLDEFTPAERYRIFYKNQPIWDSKTQGQHPTLADINAINDVISEGD